MAIDTLLTNAIGDDAVTSAKLGASSVDTTALATNAVTSAKIGVDVIVAEDLAANSVTVSEITNGAVTTAKIADNAVTSSKLAGVATSLTEVATTSGTTHDFTVPNTAKVIYVSLMGLSFSGSGDTVMLQIGDAGGIETSGYNSAVAYVGGGHANNGDNYNSGTTSNGFFIYFAADPSDVLYGHAIIVNGGGNKFTCSAQINSGAYIGNGAGYKQLSAPITTVRLLTVNGRTFDAGAVNVTYI